ncbi:MAG TPA: glycosyltransferase family 4 protein [Actinomycetota bacterium]
MRFVINGLGTGGAERSLAELLPRLVAEGIEPSVVCLYRRDEGVQEDVRAAGFDVRFLSAGGRVGRVRELRGLLAEDRPDLVHTTIFEADLVGRLASASLRIPLVTSLVNTSYDDVRLLDPNVRRWRLATARLVDGWTARRLTTWFHAITRTVAESAVQSLGIPGDRITVIPRGRDAERLGAPSPERKERARRALALEPRDQVLLSVARQEFQKGQGTLVSAMSRLPATAVLLIAGRDGNATATLRAAASSLGDRVRFLGHRSDVPELLAAADVFVFPSIYEGLGGAVIEAMALGLPVVASDLPALHEVVEPGRSAVLVPAGNADRLAEAVGGLLRDRPELGRLGRRGRELFLEKFTIEGVARRMSEMFRSVADVGRRPGREAGRGIG